MKIVLLSLQDVLYGKRRERDEKIIPDCQARMMADLWSEPLVSVNTVKTSTLVLPLTISKRQL